MKQDAQSQGPLASYRALDLTDETGLLCGTILAHLGADVIKIEPPGGDPARRIGPFYGDVPDPETSLFWFAFSSGKRSLTLDLESASGQDIFKRLVKTADLVIESFKPGYLDSIGLSYDGLSQINPRLILSSITPFGQSGPYKDYKASDIVIAAMGGLMSLCGDSDRPPVRISVPQSHPHASAQAALGSLVALWHRELTGEGQHVDVSAQESITWTMGHAMPNWDLNKVVIGRIGGSMDFGPKRIRILYLAQDGYVSLVGIAGPQMQALLDWMDEEGMAADLKELGLGQKDEMRALTELSQELRNHVEEVITRFTRGHTVADIFEEAVRRRIMFYPVTTPRELFENAQLLARDFWVKVKHPELGISLTYPGAPYKLSHTPWRIGRHAPLIGEHNQEIYEEEPGLLKNEPAPEPAATTGSQVTRHGRGETGDTRQRRLPLAGIKVADFSWAVVGPLTTKHLADHGATVVRIESSTRPEVLRRVPPYKDNIPGADRTGWFASYNNNKYGMALNLNHPRGQEVARRLVAWADVVVESFTPGVMARWGLDYPSLARIKPDIVMLSACMMGQTGPYALHLGYGNTLQHLAGFGHLTGWPDREPVGTGVAYTDYFVPHLAAVAILAALDHRRRTGEGQYIDFSQLEAGLYCSLEALMDYSANGRVWCRNGNRSQRASPHGAFRCLGNDRWCVLAVSTEEEWQAFCHAMGDPAWARQTRFSTLRTRKENEDELERLIEAWTIEHRAEEVMELLQKAGVPAGVVKHTGDVRADLQLQHRQHYRVLRHSAMGEHSYDAPSFRLSKTPAELKMAAPCLGEHTEHVCTEILGMTDEEFARLAAEGVFD